MTAVANHRTSAAGASADEPEGAGVDEALFVQARPRAHRRRRPTGGATAGGQTRIVQQVEDEDRTIVIDLTDEATATSVKRQQEINNIAGGGDSGRMMSASVVQWSGIYRPALTPGAAANSLDCIPQGTDDDSGSSYLIARMLNGQRGGGGEDGGERVTPPSPDDVPGEILEIRATVEAPAHWRAELALADLSIDAVNGDHYYEEEEVESRHLSNSVVTEKYVESTTDSREVTSEEATASATAPPARPLGLFPPIESAQRAASVSQTATGAAWRPHKKGPPKLSSGPSLPLNLFGSTSQSLAEITPARPPTRYYTLQRLRDSGGQGSLDRSEGNGGEGGEGRRRRRRRSVRTSRSASSDFLDRMDASQSGSVRRSLALKGQPRTKISKIERGLYLGGLEAATDVILLESIGEGYQFSH